MAEHELVFSTFDTTAHVDLMPYQFGREACVPGHAFGPARRNHYLFHYIISGKGTLIASDEAGAQTTYHLAGGSGFCIFPEQVNTYLADMEDPWEYIWVEFDGLRVRESLEGVGLAPATPVYRSRSAELTYQMEQQMRNIVDTRRESPLQVIGYTYLFFDLLLRSIETPTAPAANRLQDFYIKESLTYIERHYRENITVEDIAKQTGLNRSYFGKVFKQAMGKSPQQYLMSYRMTKAAELLKLTSLSVADVGREVGYPNQLHFSRVFKNAYGISPRAWRQANTQ